MEKQPKQKIIGVDARFYGTAGPGRYTKSVIQHLEKIDTKNKYIVFLNKKGYEEYDPKNSNFTKKLSNYKWYSFAEQIGFLFKILNQKLDLFYVPHFNIPVLYPGKLVTAIPDIIMHTFSTEAGTTLPKWYFRFKKVIYKTVVWIAVQRSQKIIIPSNATKHDFMKVFPKVEKDKYILAYEGVDPDVKIKVQNPDKILENIEVNPNRQILLYVSSMYEHKNIERLIKAFVILKEKYNFDGQLVLVGKRDKFAQRIYEYTIEKNLKDDIIMPGMKRFITDEEVAALRTKATLYVFPSLKEGFSLTPLEAMSFGLPAVISNIDCHKEIYGDSVEYFDPLNETHIAKKINSVLVSNEKREELKTKGYALTKRYSWDETAKVTLDTFNSILKDL